MATNDPNPVETSTESVSRPQKPVWRRKVVLIPVLVLVLVLGVLASLVFQPWRLFVDNVVFEPVPTATQQTPSATKAAPGPSQSQTQTPPEPTGPVVVSSGRFISHEHGTTGEAQILRLADGQNVLRLENLATSNGPDLKVWLSKGPVVEGRDGWFVFKDYPHVDLGALKGNVGNQNYPIPSNVDPSQYSSVVIWCDRFSVSFGAAELS